MVKVLLRDSNDLKAVEKYLDYIGRHGKLELETDDGERLGGRVGKRLLDDWDLDIDDVRRQSGLAATKGRKPPKIVHKLMFSMPPGTPPDKILTAVHNFAREEFWGQHRYAMVLHTDEDHPHVHLVLKAISEQAPSEILEDCRFACSPAADWSRVLRIEVKIDRPEEFAV